MSGCNGCDKATGRTGNAGMRSRPGPGQKVVLYVALDQVMIATSGSDSVEVSYLVDAGPIANYGPMLESLRAHYQCQGASSANFKGRVTGAWSMTGEIWSTPFEILGYQAGDGQVISAEYTTKANFGLKLRFAVGAVNNTGTSTVQTGRITLVIEATLKT